jgi:translation initiation factor 5B
MVPEAVRGAVPELREPIVSLLGHVDHGKTTLLDRIAGSVRASHEAGGITQHIGAIEVPGAVVRRLCEGILRTEQLVVPGLLFVDTPGHRSFETMRRRGGALADLAILVIDAREGVMPQTRESFEILRHEKTPFAVALTKIDLLSGWRKPSAPVALAEHIGRAGAEFSKVLDERVYAVAEEVVTLGLSADRYDRVSDFTRNIGIVPVSAKTGVGVPELIALLVGLSQRFLKHELAVGSDGGEATILERSDQRGVGPVGNVIVYRGRLAVGDEIVATGRDEPFSSRIRGIYRPVPLKGGQSKHVRLASLSEVKAAAGVYLAAPGIEEAMPGGLLKVVHSEEERSRVTEELALESQPVTDVALSGIAIYADTLGGLEALAFECRQNQIPVHEAAVGPVGRSTILRIADVRDPTHRAVIAFNVPVLPDALPEGDHGPVHVFRAEVMYRAIEEYLTWKSQRERELQVQQRLELIHPAKFEILSGYVFRVSKPAIVGIRVLGGTLRPGVRLIRPDGTEVGVLKALQKDGTSVPSAEESTELAASIDGAVVGRNVREGDTLLVGIPESMARALKGRTLTPRELEILEEVARIHRPTHPFWGQ